METNNKYNLGKIYKLVAKVYDTECIPYYGSTCQKYLSSRLTGHKNDYKKYLTTMVGLNKFDKASKLLEEVYFIFSFDDGLYYYKYEKADKFEIKKAGRWDRGRQEIKDYVFIAIENLSKII